MPSEYYVLGVATERAVRRFRQYREADPEDLTFPDQESTLRDFVLNEIHQKSVTYVGGQPLDQFSLEHRQVAPPNREQTVDRSLEEFGE